MKGQISVEFAVLMVFMMLVMGGLFVALQSRMVYIQEAQNLETLGQLGNLISNEVQLAAQVGDGYRREFQIPPNINGQDYTVVIQDKWDLVVSYDTIEFVSFLDVPVQGSLVKGKNIITNTNGNVVLS